ncbi:MAG: bifunctional isocitrate dehydrogenase kinase/phosphatase [Acidiferrobacterales bacterium]|nr:bifunctional isocitrate dehydrogenase kinase/phosphatase [Acidiferrobacterales bacterium]
MSHSEEQILCESAQATDLVYTHFKTFYQEFRQIPNLAKKAFEKRDHQESLNLSSNRLRLYSISIRVVSDQIKTDLAALSAHENLWVNVETDFQARISAKYYADLAMAYLHSIRRKIYQGEWRVEDYSLYRSKYQSEADWSDDVDQYPVSNSNLSEQLSEILRSARFDIPYEDLHRDINGLVERTLSNMDSALSAEEECQIEMFRAGFFRNRGAYLVGRIVSRSERIRPFIIALLNGDNGVYVDALIMSNTYAHNMFSSTLANFHVTNEHYHELCGFLRSIMPARPLGLHYSTVGYNHLGKVAVMNEIESERNQFAKPMSVAPGTPGTVAIGFCMPDSAYVLKVVRDKPTAGYKWGKFEGVESVLRKYNQVHEINRTDSMLDSIIYYNFRLRVDWFDHELKTLLLDQAADSVRVDGDDLIFKYLIVQRKLTPLPVYLETANQRQQETVMVNLGYCIKNNAAGNIFNRDLDARNYGVSSMRKVYLFDYDAIEPLTDVKIRTNLDRIEGEEDIPDWYFEDGVVFLPEELTTGLCLPFRELRRLFSDKHKDLHSVAYWEAIQTDLNNAKVPSVSVYPDSERLRR